MTINHGMELWNKPIIIAHISNIYILTSWWSISMAFPVVDLAAGY
jgi:hypothetical protein